MIAPLAKAVRDELRTSLAPANIPPEVILVTQDEKVAAWTGQVAVSIYAIDLSPSEESGNAILGIDFSLAVGVTVKGRVIPVDRRGEGLYTDILNENTISIDEIIRRVIKTIHGRPQVIAKANKIAVQYGLMYSEPLYVARSIGVPEEKGPEHWNIRPNENELMTYNEDDLEGLYQEVVFQGAKCFQPALDFEPTLD